MPTPGPKPDTTTTEVTLRRHNDDGSVVETKWLLGPGVRLTESRDLSAIKSVTGETAEIQPVYGSHTLVIEGQVLSPAFPEGKQVPHGIPVGG